MEWWELKVKLQIPIFSYFFPFSLFVLFDPKNRRFRLNYLYMKAESYYLNIFTNKGHFIFFETLPSKEMMEKKGCSKFSILFAFPFSF